jgi:hypothetical protein
VSDDYRTREGGPHPTAIPVHALATKGDADAERIRERFGDAFFLLLSCPAPLPGRPRMTVEYNDVTPSKDDAARFMSAALPIKARSAGTEKFLIVGRGDACDVPIFDETVSKFHAFIDPAGGGYRVFDGHSRNGTQVDGQRVAARGEGEPAVLRPGSVVRFGAVLASFVNADGLARMARAYAGKS